MQLLAIFLAVPICDLLFFNIYQNIAERERGWRRVWLINSTPIQSHKNTDSKPQEQWFGTNSNSPKNCDKFQQPMPTIIVAAAKPSPSIFKDAAIYQKEREQLCWEKVCRESWETEEKGNIFNLFGKTQTIKYYISILH